jgi:uncharacterized protein YbaP (TraB family)
VPAPRSLATVVEENLMSRLSRSIAVRVVVVLLAAWAVQDRGVVRAQPGSRHLLMWKASSPTTTVYLLGSIHVGDKDMYPLPAEAESAFAASKVLVVEVNLKLVDAAKTLALLQKYGMYSGDDGLSKHVPKETSEALDAYCKKNGLPRTALERFKPWCAGITIAGLALKQAGEDPSLGVDLHFLNQVKDTQRIEELETAEFQLSLLASASDQEQQEMLAETLKSAGETKQLLQKMQDAYLSGDEESLLKLLREQDSTPDSMSRKLVDDRNVTMGARVEQYLKGTEQCFVVVGAAHLVGPKGIVKMLEDKGYRVERVKP